MKKKFEHLPNRKYNRFRDRDYCCRRLGFRNYEKYINSQLANSIRYKALENSCHICKECGKLATEIFFMIYDLETMQGRIPRNIIPCCENCMDDLEYKYKKPIKGHKNKWSDIKKKELTNESIHRILIDNIT